MSRSNVTRPDLPPGMRVIVRDWLSANHVVFIAEGDNALIDTGYGARVADTLARLQDPAALGTRALNRIINTHVHSDHVGGNAQLKRSHGASITVPAAEARLIEAWDTRGLLLDYADQRCERFTFDFLLHPGDSLNLGGEPWQAIAAPGHDMGALVFFHPDTHTLISGDALWGNGFGFIEPERGSTRCLDAAQATLETIDRLDARLVIPGHGQPFSEVGPALERAYSRVAQFRRDPEKMVWFALKAFLVFSLLDRGSLSLAALQQYVENVPVYREWNAAFLQRTPQALGETLVAELERAGAVRRANGFLRPV